MNDPGRRAMLGQAARERVLHGFTYDQLAGQLQAALDQQGDH